MKQSPLKKSVTACLCAALCVVLPQALRVIPGTDGIYGLVHMPVLLCAFACGIGSALVCAVLGLSVSFLVVGLPAAVVLPVILAECLAASVMVGIMKKLLRFEKSARDIALCFAFAILPGRFVGGLLSALLFVPEGAAPFVWTGGYFITALPGMLVEMVLLPIVVSALVNAGLAELRTCSPAVTAEEKV